MNIGQYRKQLQDEIQKSAVEGRYQEGRACFAILQHIREMDDNAPAKFLSFDEIARVAVAALKLAEEEHNAGRIIAGEKWQVLLNFFALAESYKHKGEAIPIPSIRDFVRARHF